MKRISALLPLLITCAFLTGCGLGRDKYVVADAPLIQDDAGIIAKCTSQAQAHAVAQKFGGKYRILNAKKKLVEIYDIPMHVLKDELPHAKLKGNVVYQGLISAKSQVTVQNEPYAGPAVPEFRDKFHHDHFPYLDQVGATTLPPEADGEGVTVAIIDSGIAYNHPHLSPNISLNASEASENGADDDGNQFVDDYVGWDFVQGDQYPWDDHGHGTHVAGLVAGTLNGIAPKAKVLPIKVLSSSGSGDLGSILAGVTYALQRNVDVINLSLGGPMAGLAYADLNTFLGQLDTAKTADTLFIVAAGNGGSDGIGDCNDELPMFPATVIHENLLAVASVDDSNQLTSYSNFGKVSVHIAAPGGGYDNGGLLSTAPKQCWECTDEAYVKMSGTSMATPVVSGMVAAIKSYAPELSMTDIKDLLMETGVYSEFLEDKINSARVAHVGNAINSLL
jgi:subtilisin family serine protease